MKRVSYLILLLLILSIISLSVGASSFSWMEFFNGGESATQLFWESRFPRLLSILLSASAMSVSGLLMQTITQNEFASPSTIGTVDAAKLGLMMSLLLFPSPGLLEKMATSFVFAIGFSALFVALQHHLSIKQKWMIPLIGLIFGGVIGACTQFIAYQFQLVQSLSSWMQGSFSMIQTNQYEWLYLCLFVLVLSIVFAHYYTVISMGEDISRNLGVPIKRMESLTLVLIALTTSVTMITVGSLPFIGVIVPNIVRMRFGTQMKDLVPLTMFVGACLVLSCDILARIVIAPYEISVSIILSILGAALFIFQVIRLEKRGGDL